MKAEARSSERPDQTYHPTFCKRPEEQHLDTVDCHTLPDKVRGSIDWSVLCAVPALIVTTDVTVSCEMNFKPDRDSNIYLLKWTLCSAYRQLRQQGAIGY